MAGKLPKVTEYIKNVGKSMGYASIDVVKDTSEGMGSFIETNEDFFKTIYSAAKNYKKTLITASKIIKKSKIYDAAISGIQATKEDIMSGNWYNKERDSQFQMAAFGEDFADFSDFEVDLENGDWNMDDDEDIITKEPSPSETRSSTDKMIAQAALGSTSAIVGATREQTKVIANSTENLANIDIASAKLFSMQNEKIHASVLAGFQDVHSGLGIITSFATGPMTQFMNESTKFFGDTSTKLTEISAYLKEFTEMQRNLYKAKDVEYKTSKYDEIMDSNNMLDMKEYSKAILKNIKNLDPTGGMLMGDGDDNMFKAMVGSPLKMLPITMIKAIIPTTVRETIKAFDENMQGFFPTFIAKMNRWSEKDYDGDGINWRGIVGSLLGIKIGKKEKINTGAYEKGPMPFDGVTKKAIIDVIPKYLARIEAALSGQPERFYDYNSGTFKTAKQIHKEFKQRQVWAWEDAASPIKDDFDKWAKEYATTHSSDDSGYTQKLKELQKQYRHMAKNLYDRGGAFDLYSDDPDEISTIFGDQDAFKDFIKWMKNKGKRKGFYEIADAAIKARQERVRDLENVERQFGNIFSTLFDGTLFDLDERGRMKAFDPTKGMGEDVATSGNNSNRLFSRNKSLMTTNDYLKRILANIEFIRTNGVPNSNSGSSRGYYDLYNSTYGRGGNNSSDSTTRTIDDFIRDLDAEDKLEATEISNREYKREEKKKEKSEAERLGLTEERVKETRAGKAVEGAKKSIREKMDNLLKTPARWIVNRIKAADEKIFDVMFGSEDREKKRRDREGREYKGFLDYIVTRTSEIFDDLSRKLKDTFDKTWEKIKNSALGKKILGFGEKVKGALGNKFKFIRNRGKEAYDSTYGRVVNNVRDRIGSRVIDSNDINQDGINIGEILRHNGIDDEDTTVNPEDYDFTQVDDNGDPIIHKAFGGVVKKYGMAMLSPGEIVIPNRGKGRQRKDLMNEKKEKNKILKVLRSSKISHYASGTVDNPEENKTKKKKSDTQTLNDQIKRIMHEVSGGEADIFADSLIGSGVSLLTGAIGGPLLGAAIGASYGLVKHSDFLQDQLFGKEVDGSREGGLIPKSTIDFFNKHSKGMIDFGAAGAIAGLFTPFGLVGGAMAGAALGYAKDTQGFRDFMFGNEAEGKDGLISKETQEKLKKAFPSIAIGAGAGAIFAPGPFGLIGRLAIGSIAGYASTTETFKNIVLGEIGDDKKRHGGIVGAFKDGLVLPLVNKGKEIVLDLAQFTAKHIFEPVELMFKTSTQFVKNMFVSVGDRIADGLNGMFREHIGMPIEEYLREKVFKRISGLLGGIAKIPITLAKFTIGAPFEAMRAMGNVMMMSQINRGTSFIQSAAERNKERGKHKILTGVSNFLGGFTLGHGGDKYAKFDKQLEGMSANDLYLFNENLSKFINNRGKATREYGDKIEDIGGMISRYIDQNGGWDSQDKYDGKKQILEALQRGERPNDKLLERYGLQGLRSKLDEIDYDELNNARRAMLDERGMTDEGIKQLERITGVKDLHGFAKGNNHKLRTMLRLAQGEFKVKKAAEDAGEENPNEDGSNPGVPEFDKRTAENTTKLVTILSSINNYVANPNRKGRGAIIFDENGNKVLRSKKQHKRDKKELEEAEKRSEKAENKDQRNWWRKFKDRITLKYIRRGIGGFLFGKNDEEVNPDSIEGQEQEKKQEHEKGFKDSLIERLGGLTDKFGKFLGMDNKDDDEKEKPSLISRIFGAFSGGGNVLKFIGGVALKGLTGAGTLVAGLTALSIAGWGSEFFITKIVPWAKEHVAPFFGNLFTKISESETFIKIKEGILWFKEKFTDGTIISSFVNRMTQGVSFAIKNIVTPLTEAIISSFPSLIAGIAAGVFNGTKKLIFGEGATVKTDFNAALNAASNKMATGKNEREIASSFSGGGQRRTRIEEYSINDKGTVGGGSKRGDNGAQRRVQAGSRYKENGTYTEDDGSLSEVNEYTGTIKRYGSDGRYIGSYDMNTGEIIDRTMYTLGGNTKGGLLHGAVNAFGRGVATGGNTLVLKAFGKLAGISNKSIMKSFLKFTPLGLATGAVAGSTKAAAKITGGALGAAGKAGSFVHNVLTKGLPEVVAKNDGFISKIITHITGVLQKLFKPEGLLTKWLSRLVSVPPTSLGERLVNGISKLIKSTTFSSSIAGKWLAKLGASMSPLSMMLWTKSLADGWTQTESILGVAKGTMEIDLGTRVAVTLVHALNENILFGFIPTKKIVDMILSIFGEFLTISKEDIEQARTETEKLLTQAGMDTGEVVTINEYNDQIGVLTKIWRFFTGKKNPMDKLEKDIADDNVGYGRTLTYKNNEFDTSDMRTDKSYKTVTKVNKKAKKNTKNLKKYMYTGNGRGGKQGGQFANLPYGNSTIGEAGCGPVAASMLTGDSIPGLASFAQKTGHVAPDGSTDIGFFDDYLSAKGVSHTTTTDKTLTEKILRKGGNAVLLGRDPGGGNESAYSDSSHYITANGMDKKGNVLINDPELGNRVMNKNKVFRNMKASVVTGKSRGKLGYKGYGREGPPQPGDTLTSEELYAFEQINKDYKNSRGGLKTIKNNSIPGIPENASTVINNQTINLTANAKKQTNITSGDANVKKILDVAKSQVGETERTGNNDVKYNDEYYGRKVSGSNYPWCCVFVWWVFHHAGADKLLPQGKERTASCGTLKNWFAARGQIVYTAKPGDIIFMDTNNDGVRKITHVGICYRASTDGGKTITTIEGNTSGNNSGSQDNGGCVAEKKRNMSMVMAIARPAYAGATFDDAIPYGSSSVNYETGEVDGDGENGGPLTLFEKIAKLGKTVMKSMFGTGLYNALFGSEDEEEAKDMANLGTSNDQPLPSNVTEGDQLQGATEKEKIWRYLRSLNFSKAGAAGIMGNMRQESGFRSNNVQDSFTKKTGIKDSDYTHLVNNGTYGINKFMNDEAGYGLVQWTSSDRKAGLYDRTVNKGKSIASMKDQLDFMVKELDDYGLGDIRNASDINAASDLFLKKYEKPKNIDAETPKRRNYAKAIYDEFSGLGRRSMGSATGMSGKARSGVNSSMNFNTNKAISTVGSNSSNNINIPKFNNSLPYSVFLETIVNILLSISSNTEALTKILNILSKNFNIDVSTSEVQNTTKNARSQARQALNTLMNDKTNAETVSHMLQTKDTNWLIQSMTELARE